MPTTVVATVVGVDGEFSQLCYYFIKRLVKLSAFGDHTIELEFV